MTLMEKDMHTNKKKKSPKFKEDSLIISCQQTNRGGATALCVMGWRDTCRSPPRVLQKEIAGREKKHLPRDPSRALVKGAIPTAGAPLMPAGSTGHQRHDQVPRPRSS